MTAGERYRLAWMSARRRATSRKHNFHKMLGVSAGRLMALDEMTWRWEEAHTTAASVTGSLKRAVDEREAAFKALKDLNEECWRITAERDEARAEVVRLGKAASDEGARALLGSIDNALRNGSYMNNANLAFELLCDRLGVDRDAPVFNPAQVSDEAVAVSQAHREAGT